ncbi:MAG: SseB family protein [Streptosporangiaceae bacterium]
MAEGGNPASMTVASDAARTVLPERGEILGAAQRFRDDDGSADPVATASLRAFADGTGSERAALLALAATRLLVPVIAKSRDMALPTLVGHDGRPAIPVFTALDAMARWKPSARPVPTDAALVWRAAVQDSCAVVIDVAGPVPLAVEGARLAALARGDPAPAPHEDPDVQAVIDAVIIEAAAGRAVGVALGPGVEGGDVLIEIFVADSGGTADLAGRVGSAVMEQLGSRLRRGVAVSLALSPPAGQRG